MLYRPFGPELQANYEAYVEALMEVVWEEPLLWRQRIRFRSGLDVSYTPYNVVV
jgi:hypothetical protein